MNADLPKSSWRRQDPFRLGDLEVFPESGEIRGRQGPERLRPLLMDVLLRLAAQPGEVVRRETLLEEVWPRRMVNDEVLSRAIAELRLAIGDDARQSRFIETLPKIGYRLIAPVEPLDSASPAPTPVAAARPGDFANPGAGRSRQRFLAAAIGAGLVVAVLAVAAVFLRTGPAPGTDLERRVTAAQPFTSDPELEIGPRFSPDGKRIAFALGEGANSRIVIQPLDGTPRRTLAEPGALRLNPVFFPDGRRLAFWQSRGGDCAIVEYDLDAGTSRSLLDCALSPRARFDISPDGKRLMVTAVNRPQFPAGLVSVDIATGKATPFTATEPGFGDDTFPRFSPDGRRIAFFRGTQSHQQLWIADVKDATTAKPAAKAEGLTYGAAWLSPDGPILVASDWSGFRALNLVDLDTGLVRMIGARGARFPDASRDGAVVYENAVYSANLWLVELAGDKQTERVLWPSTRYTNQAQFSPDGKQLVFVSNREGVEAIYVGALDGEPKKLVSTSTYRFIRPHWSADGQAIHAVRIAVAPARPALQEAVRIEVRDGSLKVLAELGTNVTDVRESRDGKWLFVAEQTSQAMRLLRASAANPSSIERLPLPLTSEYQLNGDLLVFGQSQLTGLTSCRLEGLTCEPLDIAIGDGNRYDWALGDNAIFFRLGAGQTSQLARFDLGARRLDWRSPFAPTAFGGSVAVAPGDQRLVVSREERTAIDLMLVR